MKNDFEYLNIEDHISLSDMSLAGCLVTLGFPVISFDRDPSEYPKVKMVFEKSKEIEEVIKNFFNGSLLVEPKSYWNAIREIKSRIRMN